MNGSENGQWQAKQGAPPYNLQGQWTGAPPATAQGQGNTGPQYSMPALGMTPPSMPPPGIAPPGIPPPGMHPPGMPPPGMPPPRQGFNLPPSVPQGHAPPPPWGLNVPQPPSQSGMYGAPPPNTMGPPPGAPPFQRPPSNWQAHPGQGHHPPTGGSPQGYHPPPPRYGPPTGPTPGWNQGQPPPQPHRVTNPPRGYGPNSQSGSTSQPPYSPGYRSRPPQSPRYQGPTRASSFYDPPTSDTRDTKEEAKAEVSEDQAWVDKWLADKGKELDRKRKSTPGITISEARNLFREALRLTDQLKNIISKLEQSDGDEEELTSQATEIRERLSAIRDTLNDADVVIQLQTKICKKQKKRTRQQRQREERRLIREEEEARRQQQQQEIEQWHKTASDKRAEEKREKEMKDAADLTLAEVRRKLVEAKKGLDLLQSLSKLRRVRKETAKQRGFLVPKESDRMFEERLTSLRERLTSQVEVYDAEKKTLEVMMETENQEDINRERGQERKRQIDRLQRWEKQIKKHLFGPQDKVDPSDPLYNFKAYYYGAESSPQAFLQIRAGWDMFLVPPTAISGSTMPCRWVEAVSPSSEVWKSALKSQQDIKQVEKT